MSTQTGGGRIREDEMDTKALASLPVIAVAMGDPSGISPELTARILSEPDLRSAARYIVFGDYRLFQLGAKDAGLTPISMSSARARPCPPMPASRSSSI